MIAFEQLVAEIDELTADILEAWIEQGYVRPRAERGSFSFSEIDAARVRMICDFHYTLRIEEDTMPVLLNLLDQMYGLRRRLNALSAAVQGQPEAVRNQITEEAARLVRAAEE
jgi:chaperone modulatory protein CbpM